MKKLVMTAAVLTCAASIVSAQTVTSANMVGYNKDVGSPGFHISGYAFQGADTTPAGVLGDQLAIGTKVYTFNGATYDISTYEIFFDLDIFQNVTNWNPNTLDLSGDTGFWVENVTSDTAILSGEVALDDAITNSIATGFQLISYPYPVGQNVLDLGFDVAGQSVNIGDKIYAFNGATYDISTYEIFFDLNIFQNVTNWNPDTVSVDVGEGFWYEAVAPSTWIAVRPFNP